MATMINNPGSDSSSSGTGFGIAVVLAVLVILALVIGIPALNNSGNSPASASEAVEAI